MIPRQVVLPVGVKLSADVEFIEGLPKPYRARVRWSDAAARKRRSVSESSATEDEALAWIERMRKLVAAGVDPTMATMSLAEYGTAVMGMALRGLERKTTDPYLAGWRLRVVPWLGHLPVDAITHGAVDRAVYGWIADGHGRSTIKNSAAVSG